MRQSLRSRLSPGIRAWRREWPIYRTGLRHSTDDIRMAWGTGSSRLGRTGAETAEIVVENLLRKPRDLHLAWNPVRRAGSPWDSMNTLDVHGKNPPLGCSGETGRFISGVGILTADRPALLGRGLNSYIKNAAKHLRQVEYVVFDDSKDAANRHASLEVARALARN